MSFLDDLKKEAEQVKQRNREAQSSTQIQRDRVLQSIRPRLEKLYGYLKETCDQLNVVDPDVHMSYDVRGFGKLGPLRQRNYRVNADDPTSLDKFTLAFDCVRPDKINFEIKGKETAAALKEYLWSCNMRFTSKMTADGDGVFFMEAFVPVSFEFEADLENAKIILRERNLENLGQNRSVFDPEALDTQFMDELAKCMIRKENRFHEMTGNTMSKEARMALRQQLEKDKFKREVEASKVAAPSDPAAAKKRKKKGLLRSLFK